MFGYYKIKKMVRIVKAHLNFMVFERDYAKIAIS